MYGDKKKHVKNLCSSKWIFELKNEVDKLIKTRNTIILKNLN